MEKSEFQRLYVHSLDQPEQFWASAAESLHWHKKWDKVFDGGFEKADFRWFIGGQLNVAYNCLDRHLGREGDGSGESRNSEKTSWLDTGFRRYDYADKPAIIWEPDDHAAASRIITYRELHAEVCRAANMLKSLGVKPRDCVTIYMPMIPEAAIAMLACARIGAVHSVVFGGFSAESLKNRIIDADSRIVITADEGVRGGKKIPLKINVDQAIAGTDVDRVVMVRRTGDYVPFDGGRDYLWHELMEKSSPSHEAEFFDAEQPLFILYTSGSTGKPKGVLHTSGGYLLHASMTHRLVFDLKPEDIYWCTADVGWITGHSYIVYGPLANGCTTLMFEGVPSWPDASRFWQVVDKYKVSIFYTAPTAIRALMREGDEWVKKTSRASLRLLGSVGEPINPEAWRWYHDMVGDKRCDVVDTWWQTETGGIMISPLPASGLPKPGAATKPLFGVEPVLLDGEGREIAGAGEGALCIKRSWPGQARTVYGDHERFIQTYFSTYKGYYFTGDGAKRDDDGDYWITGRIDDVLNVSGHRLGTAEIESALVAHQLVAEAAVVGFPHHIKGEGIYAYVTLKSDVEPHGLQETELADGLKKWVRMQIGAIAAPDVIHFAAQLPKTRSGKIMRRILRKIAAGDVSNLGDISTLLNPESVQQLVAGRV